MKWVTRERAKVDRVACPWLIKKFVDPQAEFLFVAAEEVMQSAERDVVILVAGAGGLLLTRLGAQTEPVYADELFLIQEIVRVGTGHPIKEVSAAKLSFFVRAAQVP